MDILTPTISAIVALIVVFISGYYNLRQVKINNLTSSKIEWFRKVRDSISSYLTYIDSVATEQINLDYYLKKEEQASKTGNKKEAKIFKKQYLNTYDIYRKINDEASRNYLMLKLLIYKDDEEFKRLEETIDHLDKEYQKVKTINDQVELRNKILNSIKEIKIFFGSEWDKL